MTYQCTPSFNHKIFQYYTESRQSPFDSFRGVQLIHPKPSPHQRVFDHEDILRRCRPQDDFLADLPNDLLALLNPRHELLQELVGRGSDDSRWSEITVRRARRHGD